MYFQRCRGAISRKCVLYIDNGSTVGANGVRWTTVKRTQPSLHRQLPFAKEIGKVCAGAAVLPGHFCFRRTFRFLLLSFKLYYLPYRFKSQKVRFRDIGGERRQTLLARLVFGRRRRRCVFALKKRRKQKRGRMSPETKARKNVSKLKTI